jgi:hypothetical protein
MSDADFLEWISRRLEGSDASPHVVKLKWQRYAIGTKRVNYRLEFFRRIRKFVFVDAFQYDVFGGIVAFAHCDKLALPLGEM